jgi:NAD(P)-dependent dehydrogenase (short-subunit alcohol dehydrogenase family)
MTKKVCVVTGSSSGIGAATARIYAKNGWNVALNYSRERAPAERVAHDCEALGAEVLTCQADVSDDAQCLRFFEEVKVRWGRCDVLVNNAGTTKFVDLKDLDGLDADDFQRIYAVNVVGAFQMTRAFRPLLTQQVGSGVVNVSSIAPAVGGGSSIAYIASKGALNALTLVLARVLGPEVRVNAVAPGMVESPWLKNGLGAERYEANKKAYVARAALLDIITPEDVAEAVFWFGAGALKTTGEVLLIDAGMKIARA